jgi:hypothetical protein
MIALLKLPFSNFIGNGDGTGTALVEVALNSGTYHTLDVAYTYTYDQTATDWTNYLNASIAHINTALGATVAIGDILTFRLTDNQQVGFVPVVLDSEYISLVSGIKEFLYPVGQ